MQLDAATVIQVVYIDPQGNVQSNTTFSTDPNYMVAATRQQYRKELERLYRLCGNSIVRVSQIESVGSDI